MQPQTIVSGAFSPCRRCGNEVVVLKIGRWDEPEDVYRELVDGLAGNVVPMVILCVLLVGTGTYGFWTHPSAFVLVAMAGGVAAALVKIAMVLDHQRHRLAYRHASLDKVRRHETLHGVSTIAVSLAVSLFSVAIYSLPDPVLHLAPVCLWFGYSASLIARVSIRPHIAGAAILSLGLPSTLAIASLGTPSHLMVAVVFAVFTAAGIQSVGYVYQTARDGVALRLQLAALARRDPLTGLLNRLGLRDALAALPQGGCLAVAIHTLDLDGFKAVNDAFGHQAGDRLLAILAARVQSSVSEATIVARTGGDEFVLAQIGVNDEEAVGRLAERIHRQLTRPCDIGVARPVTVGLSLGYATGLLSQVSLDDPMHQADARSYAVKRGGGGVLGPGERVHRQPAATPSLARRAVAR
ncbi:GGDEF domain-containing protein [Aureimonas sp. N4]|uniref:GGDEF domain-containing protein n=1 Tax=Aureimonas sp. N4 TaxID=1638165 RepID=UPI0009E96679|nr:GGDEF domain-containing protein [Aureimonas sp. N4]